MLRKKLKALNNLDPDNVHRTVCKGFKNLKKITPNQVESSIQKFRIEVKKHMATAISAAFALVMALVWKDAVQAYVDNLVADFHLTQEVYFYRIIVAVLVTIICVLGILFISRWSEKEIRDEKCKKDKKSRK